MKDTKVILFAVVFLLIGVTRLMFPTDSLCANAVWYVAEGGTFTCTNECFGCTDNCDTCVNDCPAEGNEGNPFGSIQDAINAASNADTVIVADGTYLETIDYGGRIITVRSANGNPENCTIDANVEGKSVVWFHNGEYSSAVLDGFTITNSESEKNGPLDTIYHGARYGAGINIGSDLSSSDYASPTIKNCIIRDCKGGGANTPRGGGVFIGGGSLYSSPRFYNCKFLNNDSNMGGGAVYVDAKGTPAFYNCIMSGYSISGGTPWGRAVFVEGDDNGALIHLTNCTIQDNSGASWTVCLRNCALVSIISNCIVRGGSGGSFGEFNVTGHSISPGWPVLLHSNVQKYGYTNEAKYWKAIDGGQFSIYENNYDTAPKYVDATAKNFHLVMDTEDISRGAAGTSEDYDGNLRPYFLSNNWDVGAFEFNFCYLVENGINENTSGPSPNGWNDTANAQWKAITAIADDSGGGTTAVDEAVAAVVTGTGAQDFDTHFYKINFSGNNYGVLRVEAKDNGTSSGDTYGYLIDARDCETGRTVAEDDNSGDDYNFKIDYPYISAKAFTAIQSSTYEDGVASRAIDGNFNGVWEDDSVTHTNSQLHAWWQLDMGEVYDINAIKLYNRTDCRGERLLTFYVLISNAPMGTGEYSDVGE